MRKRGKPLQNEKRVEIMVSPQARKIIGNPASSYFIHKLHMFLITVGAKWAYVGKSGCCITIHVMWDTPETVVRKYKR